MRNDIAFEELEIALTKNGYTKKESFPKTGNVKRFIEFAKEDFEFTFSENHNSVVSILNGFSYGNQVCNQFDSFSFVLEYYCN